MLCFGRMTEWAARHGEVGTGSPVESDRPTGPARGFGGKSTDAFPPELGGEFQHSAAFQVAASTTRRAGWGNSLKLLAWTLHDNARSLSRQNFTGDGPFGFPATGHGAA
ncbi:hypothetical protein GCM10010519_54020 [Streptomyces lactacystinicus]